jgi:REP element-mobilizing transposase RayT
MARPLRVEFPGALYHVTARGNERRAIFRDDDDRLRFLATLEEASAEHGLRIHGYCLMPNHHHLLVETPGANLSRAIGWLQTTYTIRFNRRHRRSGHLFQGRFKAQVIDADDYARQLLCYIHLNPVRPRDKTAIVPAERRAALDQWRWSSHLAYLGRVPAPAWLCTDWLAFFGRTPPQARRNYQNIMNQAFGRPAESPWEHLRGGLALGSESLHKRVKSLLKEKKRNDELKWVSRAERNSGRIAAAASLAATLPERRWQAWVRVRLGGERRIDAARACGYKDGSAITHLLARLQTDAQTHPTIPAQMARLETNFHRILSSFKRRTHILHLS